MDDEVTPELVRGLLYRQAPQWARLPVRHNPSQGSSNHVQRLGDELAVRLPRTAPGAEDLLKEARWLPHLAPGLPAPVPKVEFVGEPSQLFGRPWTVVRWLDGTPPGQLDARRQRRLAGDLGEFVAALHRIDTAGQPHGAEAWWYRCGDPVTDEVDGWVAEAAPACSDVFRPEAVAEAWRRLRRVGPSTRHCWVHTDLSSENVLVHDDGSLAGVVDFGAMGVGDPAVDLAYAWSLFDPPAREVFREASGADDDMWARARAWAFVGPGLVTFRDHRHTMPDRTRRMAAMVEAVAAEVGVALH